MFKRYIALGDSISIDEYPLRETGIARIGAASLLAKELRRRDPSIAIDNLAVDGATTDDVLRLQLPHVRESSDECLVTVTAGGNDLLVNLGTTRPPVRLVEGVIDRLARILDEIQHKLPNALTILGTVYDPSDATNTLYGEHFEREAQWLARVNDGIRVLAEERKKVRLADIHAQFLGHGITVPERERWYWSGLIFEPNAEGARQVAGLWSEVAQLAQR